MGSPVLGTLVSFQEENLNIKCNVSSTLHVSQLKQPSLTDGVIQPRCPSSNGGLSGGAGAKLNCRREGMPSRHAWHGGDIAALPKQRQVGDDRHFDFPPLSSRIVTGLEDAEPHRTDSIWFLMPAC
jgi:hypothetical protein